MSRTLGIALIASAAAAISTEAFAQSGPAAAGQGGGTAVSQNGENGGASVSELVVTATRREESVTNIPLAVTAFSGQKLQQFNVTSIQDLSKLDPSLTTQNLGASQQQIVIRGISSNVGSTTGIYLDEAPLVGGANDDLRGDGTPGLRLHDLERVEVLKGPQGTLFGAGSMDGTLRVVTAKPDLNTVTGFAEATAAGVNGRQRLLHRRLRLQRADREGQARPAPGGLGRTGRRLHRPDHRRRHL
ncbi:MAG: Plug domain-containing protein [Caulobacteraceae bacterium]